MPRVFVAIGSNIDPEKNVLLGLRLVDAEVGVRSVSSFYQPPLSTGRRIHRSRTV